MGAHLGHQYSNNNASQPLQEHNFQLCWRRFAAQCPAVGKRNRPVVNINKVFFIKARRGRAAAACMYAHFFLQVILPHAVCEDDRQRNQWVIKICM